MEIKSSLELLADLVGRGAYNIVYVEHNIPLSIPSKGFSAPLNNEESVDLIISSAISGAGGIGFYNSPISPRGDLNLRGVAIFVTTKLSSKVDVPIIFCRDASLLIERFKLALKVSEEFKIPVILSVNENALNNFIKVKDADYSIERISPLVTKRTFDNFNLGIDLKRLSSIYDFLIGYFKNECLEGDGEFSFIKSTGKFFKFFVPYFSNISFLTGDIYLERSEIIFVRSNFTVLNENVRINEIKIDENISIRDALCPGCPFMLISKNIDFKDKILVTDINCLSLKKVFDFVYSKVEDVMGLTVGRKAEGLLFIGKLSNFKPKMVKMLSGFNFIFLNDGVNISGFPTISKPYKFKTVNAVFPYSCNNIPKYKPFKVNVKKCICFKKKEDPYCINKSLCPALYELNGAVAINDKLCVGCNLCALNCPYGAIK
ncbi:MAG: 4Fe-4S binding protein [Deferribacterales bacterium]